MIAFDPDKIEVEITDTQIDNYGKVNVDWNMNVPEQGDITYIQISPELRDFLKLCDTKHGVIGFEYDFEEAGLNFGVVLKKENS